MKRHFIIMLIIALLAAALAACAAGDTNNSKTTPEESATDTTTPPPDYSDVDFSGNWRVSGIIATDGTPLSSAEMSEMTPGFTLELLSDGKYFVYDADGATLGQGQYSVSANKLTCTAEDEETVYEIIDSNTLKCTADDKSATVMSRVADEEVEDEYIPDDAENPEDESPDDADDTEEAPEDDTDTQEDADNPEASESTEGETA